MRLLLRQNDAFYEILPLVSSEAEEEMADLAISRSLCQLWMVCGFELLDLLSVVLRETDLI
jgi:hypothetical protein